jgi:S-adenosylmethionine hydrolase
MHQNLAGMKKRTPVITLLTDFGLRDEYVGVMKGVILSINHGAQVVDITHGVARHDVVQAALIVKTAYHYFPANTIHVIVVDPGVGGERRILCCRKDGHCFIAPDNGALSFIMQGGSVDELRAITNEAYFLRPVSHTFHGRDIFAPVAAHVSKGLDMSRLGREISLADVVSIDLPSPFLSPRNALVGKILSVDAFGNLTTNVDQETLLSFRAGWRLEDVVITLGRSRIRGVSTSYDSVKVGSPVAVFGSRKLLEIAVNQMDARTYFKARVGQAVTVRLPDAKDGASP